MILSVILPQTKLSPRLIAPPLLEVPPTIAPMNKKKKDGWSAELLSVHDIQKHVIKPETDGTATECLVLVCGTHLK